MIGTKTLKQIYLDVLKSLLFILVILFLVIIAIVVYAQNLNYQKSVDDYHHRIHKIINHTIKYNITQYSYVLKRIVSTSKAVEYFSTDDREKLFTLLKPKFDLMVEENRYFNIMHVVDKTGSSYLRVHKKQNYADNLVDIRPMVKAMIHHPRPMYGYETGKNATAYRLMHPLMQDNKFIAYLEIGINPNYFIEKIHEILGDVGTLFIHQDNLKLYSNSSMLSIGKYNLQTNVDKKTLSILKLLPFDYNFQDNIRIKDQNKTYVVHSHKLLKYDGGDYAYYLFIQDITSSLTKQQNTIQNLVLALLVFMIVAFFIIYYFLKKLNNEVEIFYENHIKEIKFNQNYLRAIEDASPNLIISSIGRKIDKGNQAFLDFTGYASVQEFKAKHTCICDLFISREGFLHRKKDAQEWFEYMRKRPNEVHKAIMLKEGKEHIFVVSANELHLDDKLRCMATFVDITAFENLKDRYEFAISGTQDGLWDWNLVSNELYFTPQWKKQLGYEDDELKNERATWESLVHPFDKDQAIKDYTANIQGKTKRYENIHRLRHKDGSWVWILDRGQAIFDAQGKAIRMVGFHTNITEVKELELELKRSQKVYFDFFDNTKSANIIYSTPDEGKTFIIKSLNHLVEEIEDVSKEEIIGKRVDEVFSGIEEFGLLDIFKQVYKSGKAQKVPLKFYEDKKLTGWRENYVFKLSNGDIVASYEDKTKEKQLEFDLVQKEELMIAQSRHAAMGEMISMIAHQWRQPISVISMGANNILADIELDMVENNTLKQGAKDIIDQTKHLSQTIDDFRNFFKPDKHAEEVYVQDIFEDVLTIIGKSLENNTIEVKQKFAKSEKINTYSRELLQVFINILNNSKEALVEKVPNNREIEVQIIQEKDQLIITFCDNAGGVPKDIIQKIFDPYFTTKQERNGTGLGLYMSKTIIEKHLQGSLNVSNKDAGACFEIQLPLTLNL
ncbi:MAG: PAS domain-containing protein [Campylobacterota bacterium]|nr:PAS domain-containing protein [Campylobacterota bacterium]